MTSLKDRILFFFLLSLATLFCNKFITQHQIIGPQLLANADFSAKLNQWDHSQADNANISINKNELSLKSPATDISVRIHQTVYIPMNGKLLGLNALIRTQDIITGDHSYKARLLLVQYLDSKINWNLPHQVVALEGTNNWQDIGKAFRIAEKCSEFRVVVQLSHCSGELFLKNLSLHQVKETKLYHFLKWTIRIAWLSFILLLFAPYIKTNHVGAARYLTVLTVTAIFIGTTIPATVKNNIGEAIHSELTENINTMMVQVSPAENNISSPDWLHTAIESIRITKFAHFLLFALLVLVLRHNNPTRPVQRLMLDIFMLSCATELNQFFTENRSPLVTDVLIDLTGGATGVLLSLMIISKPIKQETKLNQ